MRAPAQQYTDVLSAQPGRGEKHRGERAFARCDETHRAPASARTRMCGPGQAPWTAAWFRADAQRTTALGARPFWLLFGALRRRSGANSGAGPKGGGQDARSHAKKVARSTKWSESCGSIEKKKQGARSKWIPA